MRAWLLGHGESPIQASFHRKRHSPLSAVCKYQTVNKQYPNQGNVHTLSDSDTATRH